MGTELVRLRCWGLVEAAVENLSVLLTKRIKQRGCFRVVLRQEDRCILDYLSKKKEQDHEFVKGMQDQRRTRCTVWAIQKILKELATVESEADFKRMLPSLQADWAAAQRYGTTLEDFVGGYIRMLLTEFGVSKEHAAKIGRRIFKELGNDSFGKEKEIPTMEM